MHSQPDSSTNTKPDAELFSHLTHLAETIEPEPTFTTHLEAKLRKAHPSHLPQKTHQRANLINNTFSRFNRRGSLFACASLAIAAAFIVPAITTGGANRWFAGLFNSTVTSKVNAQTIAQAMGTGQITLTSNVMKYDKTTQEQRAIGNATFAYPEAQIQANADEIRYIPTSRQMILLGNVKISQEGVSLRGKHAICSLEDKRCSLTQ